MQSNGCKRFLISVRSVSQDDLPSVLESVFDTFNVESVSIRSHNGPVNPSTSLFNQLNADPDLHLSSCRRSGP